MCGSVHWGGERASALRDIGPFRQEASSASGSRGILGSGGTTCDSSRQQRQQEGLGGRRRWGTFWYWVFLQSCLVRADILILFFPAACTTASPKEVRLWNLPGTAEGEPLGEADALPPVLAERSACI